MRKTCSRVYRFSAVGAIGAGVQLSLFCFLTQRCGLPGVAATPLAVEVALLHNFIWHERFTWRDRGVRGPWEFAARLGRFHLGNGLVSVGGNTILMYLLVDRLHTPALPAAICAILVCSAANFLIADRWVYRAGLAGG